MKTAEQYEQEIAEMKEIINQSAEWIKRLTRIIEALDVISEDEK